VPPSKPAGPLTVLVLVAGCVGSGDVPAQVSGRIVDDAELPAGPGLVMIEKGPVQQGSFQIGALIDADGRFTAELTEGGTWGLHIYYNETYTYLPVEITIDDHQQVVLLNNMISWGTWLDLTGQPTWPDQPDDATLIRMPFDDNLADNPSIGDITMSYRNGGELIDVTVDAADPDGDLSRMILAYDLTTGAGLAMSPPAPPDPDGNYPSGVYSLTVFVDPAHVPGQSQWQFIAVDHLCNNSPIYTFTMPPL
jgi:hypothetical protein